MPEDAFCRVPGNYNPRRKSLVGLAFPPRKRRVPDVAARKSPRPPVLSEGSPVSAKRRFVHKRGVAELRKFAGYEMEVKHCTSVINEERPLYCGIPRGRRPRRELARIP